MYDHKEIPASSAPDDTHNQDTSGSSSVLSEEKYNEYKYAFEKCDKDGSNCIDATELKEVLISLGKDPTDEEVDSMIASVDDNGNGTIEFEEFINLMEDEERSFKTEDLMRQAFGVLDPDGMGYLTTDRLRQVVANLGIDMTDDELAEMVEEADPDGSGKVEYSGIIGLIGTENETLATAFQKREKIEAIKREEIARETEREEVERAQQEELERTNDEENADGIMEHVPDMDEIASQFDNEQYDQFSRQIPVGGRVVKMPGKRLPMSTTRMKYLQRKNKSLSQDASMRGSMMSLMEATEQEDSKSIHPAEFKTHFRISSDDMMSINERLSIDPRSKSNQQRQYKHVESRLLDPKYYLKKSTSVDEQPNRNNFELAQLNSVCVDFDKTLKNFKEKRPNVPKSSANYHPSRISKTSQSNVHGQQQTYAERARQEKQLTNESKFYYAVWRSAFSQAIERLRESKRVKAIQLNTPDLLKDKALAEEKARRRLKNQPRPKPRLSVISPSLQPGAQVHSITPHSRLVMDRGSYSERFKKKYNIEATVQERKWEASKMISPRKPRLTPLQHRDVITKSALNRRTMRVVPP